MSFHKAEFSPPIASYDLEPFHKTLFRGFGEKRVIADTPLLTGTYDEIVGDGDTADRYTIAIHSSRRGVVMSPAGEISIGPRGHLEVPLSSLCSGTRVIHAVVYWAKE